MRRAMAEAEVGDDWYGDDPTVNRLQERAAEVVGLEDGPVRPDRDHGQRDRPALLVRPGHLVVCEARSHVSGVEVARRPLAHRDRLRAGSTRRPWHLRPPRWSKTPSARTPTTWTSSIWSRWRTRTRSAGGRVLPLDELRGIGKAAEAAGVALYLDGARIFNAAAAVGRGAERVRRRGRRDDVLPVEGPRRADRLGAVRSGRLHPRSPPDPDPVRRGVAAGRGRGGGRAGRPRRRAGPAARGPRQRPSPGRRASARSPPRRSTSRRWRRTSCSWTPCALGLGPLGGARPAPGPGRAGHRGRREGAHGHPPGRVARRTSRRRSPCGGAWRRGMRREAVRSAVPRGDRRSSPARATAGEGVARAARRPGPGVRRGAMGLLGDRARASTRSRSPTPS